MENSMTDLVTWAWGDSTDSRPRLHPKAALNQFSDMELLMELLNRGYVLGKHIEPTSE